ncbi:unnamed protein product, partial [Prorocentrum cordatum]
GSVGLLRNRSTRRIARLEGSPVSGHPPSVNLQAHIWVASSGPWIGEFPEESDQLNLIPHPLYDPSSFSCLADLHFVGEPCEGESRAIAVHTHLTRASIVLTMRPSTRVWFLALGLSLIAGFVDVITLVRYGEFAALQTGNMIFIGRLVSEFASSEKRDSNEIWKDIGEHAANLFSNFGGVFLFCLIAKLSRWPVRIAALLLPMLMAGGALIDLLTPQGNKWACCLVAASMGAMNFISSPNSDLKGKLFAMTALATGNLQKCAKMFFKLVSGHRFTSAELQQTCNAVTTVVGTMTGAALAGVALSQYTFGDEEHYKAWYLVIAAPVQFVIVCYHDCLLRPERLAADEQDGIASPAELVKTAHILRLARQRWPEVCVVLLRILPQALMQFYDLTTEHISLERQPSLILSVESELGIQAGLQDRVVQPDRRGEAEEQVTEALRRAA